MIKRTIEIVLSTIGLILALVFQAITIFFSFALLSVVKTAEGMKKFTDLYNKSLNDAGIPPDRTPNAATILDKVHTFAGIFVIIFVLTIILTVLGLILIKRQKKMLLTGFIFLITAILILFSTIMTGFIPAILYLIVAIMCWVRKPKTPINSL